MAHFVDLLNSLEDPAMYKVGGYCPVEIGYELHNGRYRVIHRLGYGGFSTVWLALDQDSDRASDSASKSSTRTSCSRYVAIKINVADVGNHEGAILRQIQHAKPQSRGWLPRSNLGYFFGTVHDECLSVPAVLDEFVKQGPNGSHHCLVMELLGRPSLLSGRPHLLNPATSCRSLWGDEW
ncbi:hypothetical protein BDD12DRAFT_278189 [Trichophaea hybrida]|nr:hypothetical protein BDD12DRAFT_278189 [Trichophaea hybrida]